jgi:hypothetical protein
MSYCPFCEFVEYFILQKLMKSLLSVAELGINPDHIMQKVSFKDSIFLCIVSDYCNTVFILD